MELCTRPTREADLVRHTIVVIHTLTVMLQRAVKSVCSHSSELPDGGGRGASFHRPTPQAISSTGIPWKMRYNRCWTLDNLISLWDGYASSEVGLAGVFGGSITTRRNLDDYSGASHHHYIRCEFGDWLAILSECKTAIAVI